MSKFPDFAGRKREKERAWNLIKGKFYRYAPAMKKFLDEYYDEKVPYHGPVHVLYGLAYLVGTKLVSGKRGEALEDLVFYWLGHDAGHNGVAAESPEEKSFEILWNGEFGLNKYYGFKQATKDCILTTKFPYALPMKNEGLGLIGSEQMRMLDTLRVASGATAPHLGLKKMPDPFLVCMFESCGLWLELGLTPEAWLRKGQLGFFFPHLRDCLDDGQVFGHCRDHLDQPQATKLAVATWKNHQRLWEIMNDEKKKENFLALIAWAVGNDCTLPEFVKKAKELRV